MYYYEKEVITMKNIVKFGLVGLAGYFIGFYEMKYKTIKLMLMNEIKKETSEKGDDKGESK
jgi:hypothetical protein